MFTFCVYCSLYFSYSSSHKLFFSSAPWTLGINFHSLSFLLLMSFSDISRLFLAYCCKLDYTLVKVAYIREFIYENMTSLPSAPLYFAFIAVRVYCIQRMPVVTLNLSLWSTFIFATRQCPPERSSPPICTTIDRLEAQHFREATGVYIPFFPSVCNWGEAILDMVAIASSWCSSNSMPHSTSLSLLFVPEFYRV